MKTIATFGVMACVMMVAVGCAGSSSKKTASNDVLDVQPNAVATPSKQQAYVAPVMVQNNSPADNISFTSYSTVEPAAQPASITIASAAPTSGSTYKVKAGDTLFGIARTTYGDGKSWTRIASANPGLSPKSLKAGQTITLP